MKKLFDNDKWPGVFLALYFVFRLISELLDHSSIIGTLCFLIGRLLIIIIAVSCIKQKHENIIDLIVFTSLPILTIIYLLWSILARFCGWDYSM